MVPIFLKSLLAPTTATERGFISNRKGFSGMIKVDDLVKSQFRTRFVIPAKAGIQ
jgi:hypothetical protein